MVVHPAGDPLLVGGVGQVYARTATAIYRIDLGTGLVIRTATPNLPEHVTFLAGQHWVLVKSRWSPTGVVVDDGKPATPLPAQFRPDGYLHPGPGGQLWVEPEGGTDPTPTTKIRLAEPNGRPVPGVTVVAPSIAAPYRVVADGYGDLLLTNRGGIYRLVPSRPGHQARMTFISRGQLIAAGGRRLLVWDCNQSGRCRLQLTDQRTGRRTTKPAAARTFLAENGIGLDPLNYTDALLSPDGTHVAVVTQDSTSANAWRVHVINLDSGRDTVLPGSGTDVNANRQIAWSANSRWLLALTDHQLRGFDTHTHQTTPLPIGSDPLLHLTATHTAGW